MSATHQPLGYLTINHSDFPKEIPIFKWFGLLGDIACQSDLIQTLIQLESVSNMASAGIDTSLPQLHSKPALRSSHNFFDHHDYLNEAKMPLANNSSLISATQDQLRPSSLPHLWIALDNAELTLDESTQRDCVGCTAHFQNDSWQLQGIIGEVKQVLDMDFDYDHHKVARLWLKMISPHAVLQYQRLSRT